MLKYMLCKVLTRVHYNNNRSCQQMTTAFVKQLAPHVMLTPVRSKVECEQSSKVKAIQYVLTGIHSSRISV